MKIEVNKAWGFTYKISNNFMFITCKGRKIWLKFQNPFML